MTPKDILAKYNIKPFKGFGQNFLINAGVLNKVIEAADIKGDDIILEVGPGLGILTKELAKRARKVVAVEKDRKMVEILKEELKEFNNVEIIEEDILSFNFLEPKFKVVANLPYYITSPVIRKFLEGDIKPELMVLMVQKEVGQRICDRRMSILSVSIQFYAKPEIVSYVSKGSFYPSPKIDSAILKISNIKKPDIDIDLFFKIVKAGFSQPRKKLINNLVSQLEINREVAESWLLKNNIKLNQRAETLSVNDWMLLTTSF